MKMKDVVVGNTYWYPRGTTVSLTETDPNYEYVRDGVEKLIRLHEEHARHLSRFTQYTLNPFDWDLKYYPMEYDLVTVTSKPTEVAPGFEVGKLVVLLNGKEIPYPYPENLYTDKGLEKEKAKNRKKLIDHFQYQIDYRTHQLSKTLLGWRLIVASPAAAAFESLASKGWRVENSFAMTGVALLVPPSQGGYRKMLNYLGLRENLFVDIANPDFELLGRLQAGIEKEIPDRALRVFRTHAEKK